jgi:hypothetical protein
MRAGPSVELPADTYFKLTGCDARIVVAELGQFSMLEG